MVFEKWNITTHGLANQNKFHKLMTRLRLVIRLWNLFWFASPFVVIFHFSKTTFSEIVHLYFYKESAVHHQEQEWSVGLFENKERDRVQWPVISFVNPNFKKIKKLIYSQFPFPEFNFFPSNCIFGSGELFVYYILLYERVLDRLPLMT